MTNSTISKYDLPYIRDVFLFYLPRITPPAIALGAIFANGTSSPLWQMPLATNFILNAYHYNLPFSPIGQAKYFVSLSMDKYYYKNQQASINYPLMFGYAFLDGVIEYFPYKNEISVPATIGAVAGTVIAGYNKYDGTTGGLLGSAIGVGCCYSYEYIGSGVILVLSAFAYTKYQYMANNNKQLNDIFNIQTGFELFASLGIGVLFSYLYNKNNIEYNVSTKTYQYIKPNSVTQAIENNNINQATKLINEHANIQQQDNKDLPSILHAINTNDIENLQILYNKDKESFEIPGNEGLAPIHYAIKLGNLEILKSFFHDMAKENFNLITSDRKDCIDIASDFNQKEIVDYLLGLCQEQEYVFC